MKLSTYVPSLLSENIQSVMDLLMNKFSLLHEDIAHWAIHPGGKKIINEIQNALLIQEDQLITLRNILRDYGNMSSVTMLFLLKALYEKAQPNDNILAAAFGPGLTTETTYLKTC
jgi:Predicted naringenin-chalcone synthase